MTTNRNIAEVNTNTGANTIVSENTVGITTTGAIGVDFVDAPNNQSYAIARDWDYARVQRVLANLGVTIPNNGKIVEYADGTKRLTFEATATPQNYGTKGSSDSVIDLTDEDNDQTSEPVIVGTTTEGPLEVDFVDAPNNQSYAIARDWDYARVQRVLANLGVTIPSTGKIIEAADGTKRLIFEATATPQNYGTKGSDDVIDLTNEDNDQTSEPVIVGTTTEGPLEVDFVDAPNNQSYAIARDWDYARVQRVLANLGVTIPSTGKIIEAADGTKRLTFEATATPQNYGTKG